MTDSKTLHPKTLLNIARGEQQVADSIARHKRELAKAQADLAALDGTETTRKIARLRDGIAEMSDEHDKADPPVALNLRSDPQNIAHHNGHHHRRKNIENLKLFLSIELERREAEVRPVLDEIAKQEATLLHIDPLCE